ncbi:hypothetical protein ACQ86N_11530 [Puia sp. P3]|uniref:hypothetical protein n=1 Tax=Puia sp. P3 TaxID=3423952 RepID=UPI003D666EDC
MLVEPWKKKGDIAVDDYSIKETVHSAVGERLNNSVHGEIGEEVQQEQGTPYEQLQLDRGGVAKRNAHAQN